ncbi:hypothetical protein J2T10_004148 [Paenarthrobacter nicotinovorans]|uniref:MotA/TolQ/ExbB proton channel domain-containing protein n=1 Tax=Paenarthrobacter nicotinovorans TaxID=29320 RepID=A0ABT9TUL4_PAENI|nr:hypothetical protein [Paenarthrobacter nicotinovorans]
MPIVTIIGSMLGILIALDQVTAAARLRRQVVFWRDMASLKHSPGQDAAVFHSLQREATAKVIALQFLPARRLLPSGLLILLSAVTSAAAGFTIGQVPEAELSWTKALQKLTEETGFPFALFIPFAVGIALNRGIDLILLRSRIAADYLDHKELRVSAADLAGLGLHSPIKTLGLPAFFHLIGVSCGLTLLPAALAGLAGANALTPGAIPAWALLVFGVATVFLTWFGPMLIATVRRRIAVEWHHPRPGQRHSGPPASHAPIGPKKHIRSHKNQDKARAKV